MLGQGRSTVPLVQRRETAPASAEPRPGKADPKIRSRILDALVEAVDFVELAGLDAESAREELRDVVADLAASRTPAATMAEQEDLFSDVCDDVLGYGPLEPLLARDDVAEILVNGARRIYVEVAGEVQAADVRFRDDAHLLDICRRILREAGGRVDDASPICDARLPDGSRVNVVVAPLALDGPVLRIRRSGKDMPTLERLVELGAISREGGELLEIIGRVRCNVLVSGGAGSGRTTLLNYLANCAGAAERIITCEDAPELRLRQPHVVRLETRSSGPGEGRAAMGDLVRNCLRMRPDRILVGDMRGAEAFDLLQAMNAGHDGSMATLHAGSPREALSRLELMVAMAGHTLPPKTVREMISASVDVIVQTARLRDGARRVTHVTEVLGMDGDEILTEDVLVYDIVGEDRNGRPIGRHRAAGTGSPRLSNRARQFGEERRLAAVLDATTAARPEVA